MPLDCVLTQVFVAVLLKEPGVIKHTEVAMRQVVKKAELTTSHLELLGEMGLSE